MRGLWLVFLVLDGLGCREKPTDIRRAPERELPRTTPAPTVSATVTSLMGFVGEEVSVVGTVAERAKPRIPWAVVGKSPTVLQLAGNQLEVVVHVVDVPKCTGNALFTGTVIVARGMIRQGATEGAYAEPQLDVARWSCL